jgi:hypothetical protein
MTAAEAARRGRVAWAIAGLDVVAFLVASLFDPAHDVGAAVLYTIGIASYAGVGALLRTRVPANPIGALMLASGTTLVAAIVIGLYANIGTLQVPPWPGSGLARLVGDTLFIYPFVIALIGVPLVFPDGRLPSRRFRWVVWITIANMVAWTLGGILGPSPAGRPGAIPGLAALDPIFGALQAFVLVATLVSFGAAVVAIWLRFRRGDPVQRQQVKWLVAVVGFGAVVLPVALVLTDVSPELSSTLSGLAVLAMFALPIVIAIAVLRYQLYEIDRIISRTIGWAVVTGALVTVFAALVVGLSALLTGITQGQTLAVAASTLAAFALFQPLRRRVQRAVDRRFDRARYDGDRVVRAFNDRLHDEIDLSTLAIEVRRVASETVHPVSATVWLRHGVPAPSESRVP